MKLVVNLQRSRLPGKTFHTEFKRRDAKNAEEERQNHDETESLAPRPRTFMILPSHHSVPNNSALSPSSPFAPVKLANICVHWCAFVVLFSLLCPSPAFAADRLPPAGINILDTDRQELTTNAENLHIEIEKLRNTLKPPLRALLPDVEVFQKAVDWALRYDEFFDAKQPAFAKHLIEEATNRVAQLRAGNAPWLSATGLVVRGYRSKLDGSVQPYGLVIPPRARLSPPPLEERAGERRPSSHPSPYRLEVWLAGRNEKRTELAFLSERETSAGQLILSDSIILHPYGRFCNATKFAGEVDVFEAMDAVCSQYPIDSNRIVVAGFSMGGASAWHLAVHHSGLWCAASPGAGFAETAVFAKIFAPGKEPPPEWEQKLWRWYDATDYAGNLFNCPTIAYSGEIDAQKQSADIMEQAMEGEGLKLERLIGPQTAHKYHPETLKELKKRVDDVAVTGRDPVPKEVRFTTYTLQYPGASWVEIEGLNKHWERADVRARLEGQKIIASTTNVSSLSFKLGGVSSVTIDNQTMNLSRRAQSHVVSLRKEGNRWSTGTLHGGLRKQPGLTGPIDDAFMSEFLYVGPTGFALNDRVGAWAKGELTSAVKMWRDIFRGDVPVKKDTEVTDDDIKSNNLILWGDPSSNRVLRRVLHGLPIKWTKTTLEFRGKKYDPEHNAPILIFPNPVNPKRYVVINSGIDFRNDAYGSNAVQTPKLPDWAIIDLDSEAGPRWPGKIAAAGFFDERWR